MNSNRHRCRRYIFVLLLPMLLSACALADEYRWSGVERVVAISDPHGAFDAMVATLISAGVINPSLEWSGKDAHLVITGDLMDRGSDSRKILDLVMRLESEATASGGMVHVTLGNHEVMNLVGDLRYVSRDEYAAFADEESAQEREAWFQRFRAAASLQDEAVPDDSLLRATFDTARPAGFYAHRRAFGSEGKYGRWLLKQPVLIVVNDTAFVHGGLPPMVAESGLAALNEELRGQVGDYVRQFEVLTRDGLIDPAVNFYDHAAAVESLMVDTGTSSATRVAAQTITTLADAPIHDERGPLWYRGSVSCSLLGESDVLDRSLDALGVARLVVGHTPTNSHQVLQRFDGRVIELDTGMLRSFYQGSGHALIIDGRDIRVVSENGTGPMLPVPHPRQVGSRDVALGAPELEGLLARGDISVTGKDPLGRLVATVTDGSHSVQAVFIPDRRRRDPKTEIAAYRLDLMLKLDMVPVSVIREVDGEAGTLQFLPPGTTTEQDRVARRQGGGARCPLVRQWNTMYVFDTLIGNEGRDPSNMIYDSATWQLMSVGHERAFGTNSGLPAYLATVPIDITGAWVDTLASLSDEALTENLSDVLDSRRIAALGKRRDSLLAKARE